MFFFSLFPCSFSISIFLTQNLCPSFALGGVTILIVVGLIVFFIIISYSDPCCASSFVNINDCSAFICFFLNFLYRRNARTIRTTIIVAITTRFQKLIITAPTRIIIRGNMICSCSYLYLFRRYCLYLLYDSSSKSLIKLPLILSLSATHNLVVFECTTKILAKPKQNDLA